MILNLDEYVISVYGFKKYYKIRAGDIAEVAHNTLLRVLVVHLRRMTEKREL